MGWQERDWAKWTEKERSHLVGSTTGARPGAFLAGVVSLVAIVVFGQSALHHPRNPVPIYGDGRIVQVWGHPSTSTKLEDLPSGATCDVWRFLAPHQPALPASPLQAGTRCAIIVADQASHRWICATPS